MSSGELIVEYGKKFPAIIFIMSGNIELDFKRKPVDQKAQHYSLKLNSTERLRKETPSIRFLKLPKKSTIGIYQILFDLNSNIIFKAKDNKVLENKNGSSKYSIETYRISP